VWVGLWSIVPVGGVLIGAVPIVVFAAATSATRAVVVGLVFVAVAVFEGLVVKPRLEAATMQLGSFVTVVVAFAGLELYGFTGALLALLGAALFVAALQELGPEELVEVVSAPVGDAAIEPPSDEPPPDEPAADQVPADEAPGDEPPAGEASRDGPPADAASS
jgi:predicted PurR-regulated permease PerM